MRASFPTFQNSIAHCNISAILHYSIYKRTYKLYNYKVFVKFFSECQKKLPSIALKNIEVNK